MVGGEPDVSAAGDATTFPIKQGGLATQQATTPPPKRLRHAPGPAWTQRRSVRSYADCS